MAPKNKYDTQILVGVGVLALIMMGISESNRQKKLDADMDPEDPSVPTPETVQEPNEMDVAHREGQQIIQEHDQTINPSCKTMTGKMSLDRAKETRGTRLKEIEAWRARAKYWMDHWSKRFAMAGNMEMPSSIQDRLANIDEWFDDMAGKPKRERSYNEYHLHQFANVNNQYNEGVNMDENPVDAYGQRLTGMDYPSKTKDDHTWDTLAQQRRSGHQDGMVGLDLQEPGAATNWDETERMAQSLFDYNSQADPKIDFAGTSKDWSKAIRSPTNDLYKDFSNEGVTDLKDGFNVEMNDPASKTSDDSPVIFHQEAPSRAQKPIALNPKQEARKVEAPAAVSDDPVKNMGSLEAIMEHHPLGLPPDINGDGAVPTLDKIPEPTPASLVQPLYYQFSKDGQFKAQISRRGIEDQLGQGIRSLQTPFSSWEEGLKKYRVGIAGLREIERLVAQNEKNVEGKGEKFTPQEVRQMTKDYKDALFSLSRKGNSDFGNQTYAKTLEMELSARSDTEQTPLRKRTKRETVPDPFYGTATAKTDSVRLADILDDPQIQKDFTKPN